MKYLVWIIISFSLWNCTKTGDDGTIIFPHKTGYVKIEPDCKVWTNGCRTFCRESGMRDRVPSTRYYEVGSKARCIDSNIVQPQCLNDNIDKRDLCNQNRRSSDSDEEYN